MKQLILYFLFTILMISCGDQNPKISNTNNSDTTQLINDLIRDSTKVLVSTLPIKFDSTDVTIFALELLDLETRDSNGKIGFGLGSYGDRAQRSYLAGDNLTGNFMNVVFKDKNGKERKLTENTITIRNIAFLRDIFRSTGKGYLLYSISDSDSNGDKELNNLDMESLYLSRIDGTDFKKITQELHESYDYNLLKGEDRIYFRTVEDKNKDGQLNNKDKFHYYFIDFKADTYAVAEYNPFKIFE